MDVDYVLDTNTAERVVYVGRGNNGTIEFDHAVNKWRLEVKGTVGITSDFLRQSP